MSAYPEAQYVIDELSDKIKTGGWKLQPPTNVTIANFDEAAKISWTDPQDVLIEGQTAAAWGGTVIVRKEGSAPANENDGTVVARVTTRNQYSSTPLIDSGLTNGTTYYYGVFPYTELGNFNYSFTEAFVPEEIIPIVPVINSIKGADQQVTIDFTSETPEALVKFVFKIGSAPMSDSDGTVFSNFATSPAVITGLTNDTEYYVKAFGYTSLRVSEGSEAVRVTPRAYVQFAFHYSEDDSSPDSVTYPEGYDNSNFTDPFYVNLATGVPHYGDWDKTDSKMSWLFPKPCMLKYNGERDYYLDENNYTKKADGTASDVADHAYGGNAMIEWGQDDRKIYWKIVPDSNGKGFTFVVASAQVDEDMKPWNFYDANGDETDHFYTPIYFGSSDGTRLRSISGKNNYVSQTRQTEVTQARANNQTAAIEWDTEVFCDWFLVSMLCCLISKSMNSQAKFGHGRCKSDNSAAIGQGTMNDKGMFYGRSDQTSGVKVFGMENPWGNLWRGIRGLVNANGTVKAKLTHGRQDGSTADDYNFDGTGYLAQGSISGTNGGYISHMNINSKCVTPCTISGSDSTYYTDGGWFNNSQNNYAIVGCSWGAALLCGCFCVYLGNLSSDTNASIGAALSCKPLASKG